MKARTLPGPAALTRQWRLTWPLALLHQLGPIFAIFGASDRDKSLDLKV
jgi:hypothetical protein